MKTYHVRGAYSHDGTWASVTLRGPRRKRASGKWNLLTSGPFVDYPVLRRSARLARAVAAFPGEKAVVQLFKLDAGGAVVRHIDPIYRYKDRDMVPIHVVLTTNPGARIVVNGQPLRMRAGEAWSINATLPHEVYNEGSRGRVHMILHLLYDESVAELFSRARKVKDEPTRRPGAARRYAGRYLDSLSRRPGLGDPRRKAALVAQFLKMQAGAGA